MELALPCFQKIYLDILVDDGLLVMSKGLGIRVILCRCVKEFAASTTPVFLINVAPTAVGEGGEADVIRDMLAADGMPSRHLPRVLSADTNAQERRQAYKQGGVIISSSQTLLVDMLCERLDARQVSGILVAEAHRLSENSREAFAIRHFKQKNPRGFVKGFSDDADTLTLGFNRLEKTMRALHGRKLHIWPRFQQSIHTDMSVRQADVVEFVQQQTPLMLAVQRGLVQCMDACLTELKRSARLDIEEVTVEAGLFDSFDDIIKRQLHGAHEHELLKPRARAALQDLRMLRKLISYLPRYDAVTYYSILESYRFAAFAEKSRQFQQQQHQQHHHSSSHPQQHASDWITSEAGEKVFKAARSRLYVIEEVGAGGTKIFQQHDNRGNNTAGAGGSGGHSSSSSSSSSSDMDMSKKSGSKKQSSSSSNTKSTNASVSYSSSSSSAATLIPMGIEALRGLSTSFSDNNTNNLLFVEERVENAAMFWANTTSSSSSTSIKISSSSSSSLGYTPRKHFSMKAVLEPNPKWTLLKNVLQDIHEGWEAVTKGSASAAKKGDTEAVKEAESMTRMTGPGACVLIAARDERTCTQIRNVLCNGEDTLLQDNFARYLVKNAIRTRNQRAAVLNAYHDIVQQHQPPSLQQQQQQQVTPVNDIDDNHTENSQVGKSSSSSSSRHQDATVPWFHPSQMQGVPYDERELVLAADLLAYDPKTISVSSSSTTRSSSGNNNNNVGLSALSASSFAPSVFVAAEQRLLWKQTARMFYSNHAEAQLRHEALLRNYEELMSKSKAAATATAAAASSSTTSSATDDLDEVIDLMDNEDGVNDEDEEKQIASIDDGKSSKSSANKTSSSSSSSAHATNDIVRELEDEIKETKDRKQELFMRQQRKRQQNSNVVEIEEEDEEEVTAGPGVTSTLGNDAVTNSFDNENGTKTNRRSSRKAPETEMLSLVSSPVTTTKRKPSQQRTSALDRSDNDDDVDVDESREGSSSNRKVKKHKLVTVTDKVEEVEEVQEVEVEVVTSRTTTIKASTTVTSSNSTKKSKIDIDDSSLSSSSLLRFEWLPRLSIVLYPLSRMDSTYPILADVRPNFVVMYDPDAAFTREVEIYNITAAPPLFRIYVLQYDSSSEQAKYVAALRRENKAFERLIHEKEFMAPPPPASTENDGSGGGSSVDASTYGGVGGTIVKRGHGGALLDEWGIDTTELGYSSRSGSSSNSNNSGGGGGALAAMATLSGASGVAALARAVGGGGGGHLLEILPRQDTRPVVIVDMRELRSKLPSLLDASGVRIEPVTLEVGDYVLSPSMCVERKSVPDLVGSLNSGRLYNQAEAMCRYYTRPILLIEFDPEKPFGLGSGIGISSNESGGGGGSSSSSGAGGGSSGMSDGNGSGSGGAGGGSGYMSSEIDIRDIRSKLVLLTLHFPSLRIVWSRSPHATVSMFAALKKGEPSPDVQKALAMGTAAENEIADTDDTTKKKTKNKDVTSIRTTISTTTTGAVATNNHTNTSYTYSETRNLAGIDVLRKLPGITAMNYKQVMSRFASLAVLARATEKEIAAVIGTGNASLLYGFLHEREAAAGL